MPSLRSNIHVGLLAILTVSFATALLSSQRGLADLDPPRLAAIRMPRRNVGVGSSPAYPEEARQRGAKGIVVLSLRVDGDGNVAAAAVTAPVDPALDAAAVNATRTWTYQPAAFGGRTLSTTIQASIPFLDGFSILGGIGNPSSPPFNAPTGLAIHADGSVYVADAGRSLIYKIDRTGTTMSVAAGDASEGFKGDGGPALSAQLNVPYDLAIDAAGSIYVADTGNSRIRRITPDGTISTVAGNGIAGFGGDGGPATAAQLNKPLGIAVDAAGVLYIADTDNARIRRVSTDGLIQTIAGNGAQGSSGDGGPALSAQLGLPYDVAVDAARNVYVADARSEKLRRVAPDGVVTTLMGTGASGTSMSEPIVALGIATDPTRTLYVTDGGLQRVRKVQAGVATSIIPDATSRGLPTRVAVDTRGTLYVADGSNGFVRRITAAGIVTSVPVNRTPPTR